jgi:hypothetical protein
MPTVRKGCCPEENYYEFIQSIAAAIKALRALPGVEKVVLAGHSSGSPELTSYQVVAENGPKACQDPERIYKCDGKGLDNLPKTDDVVMLDPNVGAPEKTVSLNPAVDPHHPRVYNPDLDMYNPKNGFNPATGCARSVVFVEIAYDRSARRIRRWLAWRARPTLSRRVSRSSATPTSVPSTTWMAG